MEKINLANKFELFNDHWQPKVIATMNNYQFKVAKLKGEFVWHKHDLTDEVFIVIRGELTMVFETHTVNLMTGEMIVVPKGTLHKPYADSECEVLIIEPEGVINTGDTQSDLTANNNVWV